MGRSLAPAPFAAPPSLPHAQTHPLSGVEYRATATDAGLRVSGAVGGARFERVASHVIGSGMHTQSYLWQDEDGAHRVLPLTWYSQAARWDLTPGYAVPGYPGFERAVKAECLYCHGAVSPMAGDDDGRYEAPLKAIGCSRCHGDPQHHLAGRARGEATPLLVPTRLSPEKEAAICETCHLQGAVRIPRVGKTWSDAAPGDAPGAAIATFVREAPGEVTIASHGERLRRSACRPADGPLLCTTCHAPHAKQRRDRGAACRDCHQAGMPTGTQAGKQCTGPSAPDCVACHMITVGTRDIPHVSITDHFIRTRPEASVAGPASGPLKRISPKAMPAGEAQILLARASVEAFRVSGDPADRARAEAALAGLGTDAPEVAFDRGSLALLSGDLPAARQWLEAAFAHRADARNAMSLADLRLRMGDARGAAEALKGVPAHRARGLRIGIASALGDPTAIAQARAWIAARPLSADAQAALGAALQAGRDLEGAHAALREATRLRPDLPLNWLSRARIALMRGDAADALRATDARPGAEALRVRALAQAGQMDAAARLARTLKPTPDLLVFTLRMALAAGDLAAAGQALDAAARALPTDPQVWRLAADLLTRTGDPTNAARAAAQADRLSRPAP